MLRFLLCFHTEEPEIVAGLGYSTVQQKFKLMREPTRAPQEPLPAAQLPRPSREPSDGDFEHQLY